MYSINAIKILNSTFNFTKVVMTSNDQIYKDIVKIHKHHTFPAIFYVYDHKTTVNQTDRLTHILPKKYVFIGGYVDLLRYYETIENIKQCNPQDNFKKLFKNMYPKDLYKNYLHMTIHILNTHKNNIE